MCAAQTKYGIKMKFKNYILLILSSFIFMFTVANANTYKYINAEFMLAGKIAYGDLEEGNSHLYIKIKGSDAMMLFNAMNVKAVKSECIGLKEKTFGNISCYSADIEKDSYCIFSVDIEKNKIELGEIC